MDATRKFNGRADDYLIGRPGYSDALIECMYSRYSISAASVIADIGSGTGKFAWYLLEKGNKVYCVEPNSDMRKAAEQELGKYPNFISVNGTAENTTLNEDSVDFITTAQAFHWFDVERFRKECHRILRNGGKVFLVWNSRNQEDVINREQYEINTRYCPNFTGFNGGIQQDDQRIREFFHNEYEYLTFENSLIMDKKKYIARCLSSSYSLKQDDTKFEEYLDALERLFDKYENNGSIMISNYSIAYVGRV